MVEAPPSPIPIGSVLAAGYKSDQELRLLQRFRFFVEHYDWDGAILAQEKRIDALCLGVMLIASLYFIRPFLAMLLLH